LLGVELIRRVGKRALVLAPNQGIQQQWPRAVGQFTRRPADVAGADVLKPIACLSWFLRCELGAATAVEGRTFAAALDELLGVSDAPRYLVSRPLAGPPAARSGCSAAC